jgi:ABC-2 type transport system permease protein
VSALLAIAEYELREQLRRVSTGVYFLVFLGLALLAGIAATGAWPDADMGSPVLLANGPRTVASQMLVLSLLALPVASALAGRAVHKDFEARIHPLFFTTPVSKGAYLGGRYLAAVAVNLVVVLAIPLGLLAALWIPGGDADRIGPFRPDAYAVPFAVIVVPNVLLAAAVFLVLGALTRRTVANQVGGVALLAAWGVSRVLTRALEVDWFALVSDPFGAAPLHHATRYWTVAEQNALAIPVTGAFLLNRAVWLAAGAAVLAYGVRRFRFAQFAREEGGAPPAAAEEAPSLAAGLRLPRPLRSFGAGARAAQLAAVTADAVRRILRGRWFWILAWLCVSLMLLSTTELGSIYGTRTYPVTYQVLEHFGETFFLFVLIVIAIYAGELVWEERETGSAQLHDTLPVPDWLPLAGKTLALIGTCAVLLGVVMATGMLVQVSLGYFRLEPGQYLLELFGLQLPALVLLVVLAVTVQTLANHKYVGHLIVILYVFGAEGLYLAGITHNLAHYGAAPATFYSDMNGYGHTLAGWGWFTLHWALVAVLLAVLSNLFRVRGVDGGAGWRLRMARLRATRPVLASAAAALALVLATGGFVLHNTVRLNEWMPPREGERLQARYEERYKRYESLPQPRISAVELEVEIFPRARDLRVRGRYTLVNRTGAPVEEVHVDLPSDLRIRRLELALPAAPAIADTALGYHAWRLERPLAAGDSTELRFEVEHRTRGFENEPSFYPVVGNGTFFGSELLPGIGYNPAGELADDRARARHGLPFRPRAAAIGDSAALARNFVSRDADWIRFAATVSTDADQVALAPGRRVREWREGGRRYFRYEMEVPMLNFYTFLSARYRVRREAWNGVEIEIHHHPGHAYNLDRMAAAVHRSLEYFTREFGPYPHGHVRIAEFPRYADFAQSFAGTIPYSEGIGFIAHVREGDVDYPFFVTAHEVAHQWWGHQVVPADVQGAAMLTETLAEYSALMVMEEEYGRARIGRFLRHELDGYLKGRTGERRGEMPLALVENQQYVQYNKGALAMYALRDYVGEAAVNGALRAFLEEVRFRGAPYPTSAELLRHLRAATPDSLQGLVEDLFETVTLWDLAAVRAEAEELADGRWRLDLTVRGRKLRADGLGEEERVEMDDVVEIGVFAAGEEEPFFLRKVRLTGERRTFRMELDRRPARAGIDPLHKLIDRDLDDNVVRVTRRGGAGARR